MASVKNSFHKKAEPRRSRELINSIENANRPKDKTAPGNLRTVNTMVSYPLLNRTFGGNEQHYERLNYRVLEKAFDGHYMLVTLTQCAIVRKLLYLKNAVHTFYSDKVTYEFFDAHGLFEAGFWSDADGKTIDERVGPHNVDMDVFYSAGKPVALAAEADLAAKTGSAVLFLDADLFLKKRHDLILENPERLRAAFAHYEALNDEYYPDLNSLHYPDGFQMPEGANTSLPAVNTCMMFFNDLPLLKKWCEFFSTFTVNNFIGESLDRLTVLRHLLAADQRTFPIIADLEGIWGTKEVAPFMDITWKSPGFYYSNGKKADWAYTGIEAKPGEAEFCEIFHTWISKAFIERDLRYKNYQSCLMIEIILTLMPEAEKSLRSFESLKPYFDLLSDHGTVDKMLENGVVSDKFTKK